VDFSAKLLQEIAAGYEAASVIANLATPGLRLVVDTVAEGFLALLGMTIVSYSGE
jgi:hypothetical protein